MSAPYPDPKEMFIENSVEDLYRDMDGHDIVEAIMNDIDKEMLLKAFKEDDAFLMRDLIKDSVGAYFLWSSTRFWENNYG